MVVFLCYALIMDKEALIARRKQAEDQFNALQNEIADLEKQITVKQTEAAQLQGEWRVLGELVDKADGDVPADTVSPTPDVIDVSPVTKGKK